MRQYIGRLCLTGLCMERNGKTYRILEFYEVKSVDNNKSCPSTSNRIPYIPTTLEVYIL